MSHSPRFLAAMIAAKATRAALRAVKRPATCTPGKVALKICPDFLKHLTMPQTLICVTGTNGKTTVSNLLASVLTDCGYTVTNNSYGSNVQAGVTTALLADSTLCGKAKKQVGVIEVDERSSLLVYRYVTPDFLICNNVMRDSLKRNAHTEFISYIINRALPPSTHVVLNADDLICARLAPQNGTRTYFSLTADKPCGPAPESFGDIVYCPECGTRLEAEYIRYDHIGKLFCPKCGLSNPAPDFAVTDIDRDGGTFTVTCTDSGERETFRLINDNVTNVYNFCGAIAVLSRFGLSLGEIKASFDKQKIVKSRFDSFRAGKLNVTMQLAKGQNPIACARAFSYVASRPGNEKSVLIMVDDKGDNTNDSESVCWIYDCDYSPLAHPSIAEICFAGKRCRDQKMRAVLAGVDPNKIKIVDDVIRGAELIDTDKYSDVYILYDPYILAETETVKKAVCARG